MVPTSEPDLRPSVRNLVARVAASVLAITWTLVLACGCEVDSASKPPTWAQPVFSFGPEGSFDETAVKDPSIVYADGHWHLFYTARGRGDYSLGYARSSSLDSLRFAERQQLSTLTGAKSTYAAAPQAFYFSPDSLWYLIFQTRDANYQPAYATSPTIGDPESWSEPRPLLLKDDPIKWIDFWVICDADSAFLFYTSHHAVVMLRSTTMDLFPAGWSRPRVVFSGVHEAVHVYRAADSDRFDMIYELNRDGIRSFGLASAPRLSGPWSRRTDAYVTGDQLPLLARSWTDMASHGEALRRTADERLVYDAERPLWLIQGLSLDAVGGPYEELRWQIGVIEAPSVSDPP